MSSWRWVAQLRGADGQGHRQAAAQQDTVLMKPSQTFMCSLARANSRGRGRPVDGIGRDQAAEEHDLGRQEQPHAERGRLVLLLEVVELDFQDRLVVGRGCAWASSPRCGRYRFHRWPRLLRENRRRVRSSRRAARRSCAPAAASWSATPGPWPPTGWGRRSAACAARAAGRPAAARSRPPGSMRRPWTSRSGPGYSGGYS